MKSTLTVAVLKIALILGIFATLYLGKSVLTPLVVSALLALILNPVHAWLMRKGWSKGFAVAASIGVLVMVFGGLFTAVGSQVIRFADQWPAIKETLNEKAAEIKGDILGPIQEEQVKSDRENIGISPLESIKDISPAQAGTALTSTAGLVGNFLLVFIYVALLLSQKDRLREFVLRRMPDAYRGTTHEALNRARDVAQRYLRGMLILISVLTVLYSIGFIITGLEYAIVIALLAASLSIIPYLGNIIGGTIAMALVLTSGGGTEQLIGVVITMSLAQFIESYFLTPLIVGKEVSLNPLTTVVGIIGFNTLWGPVGAIVAIPVLAIAKIVCAHVPNLEDYAFLLSDD